MVEGERIGHARRRQFDRTEQTVHVPLDLVEAPWHRAVDNAAAGVSVRGQEIWRRLALGMRGLVVAEACFATWAGRQR